MARPILQLEATEEEVLELSRLARGSKVSARDRFRAQIVLLRLEGKSETEVARALGCSLGAVCKWSKRFDREGMAGLKDASGRGRKALLPSEKISLIVERATRPAARSSPLERAHHGARSQGEQEHGSTRLEPQRY